MLTTVTEGVTTMVANCADATCQAGTVEVEPGSTYSVSCCNSDFCNDGGTLIIFPLSITPLLFSCCNSGLVCMLVHHYVTTRTSFLRFYLANVTSYFLISFSIKIEISSKTVYKLTVG